MKTMAIVYENSIARATGDDFRPGAFGDILCGMSGFAKDDEAAQHDLPPAEEQEYDDDFPDDDGRYDAYA